MHFFQQESVRLWVSVCEKGLVLVCPCKEGKRMVGWLAQKLVGWLVVGLEGEEERRRGEVGWEGMCDMGTGMGKRETGDGSVVGGRW